MEAFFRLFANCMDFIGLLLFYALSLFVLILTFVLNLVFARKRAREQRARVAALSPQTLTKEKPQSRLLE